MKNNRPPHWAIKLTAIIGAAGIILGAFGSHGLEGILEKNGNVSVWKTAVFYHLIHAVLLVLITHNLSGFSKVTYLFCAIGIFLFCGSLYLLAIFELKWLGPITPIGGVSFIIAWLTMLKIKHT